MVNYFVQDELQPQMSKQNQEGSWWDFISHEALKCSQI